jgi:hypothetical protein
MRYTFILCAVLLAGCGVESLETAATAGALEQQQLREGERQREAAQQRIDAATESMRRRQERMTERTSRF